jgi:SNF2 family DNA or RNA helicase
MEVTKDVLVNEEFFKEAEIPINQVFRSNHKDFYLSEYFQNPTAFDYLTIEIKKVFEKIANQLLVKADINNQLLKYLLKNETMVSKLYFVKSYRTKLEQGKNDIEKIIQFNEKLLQLNYKNWEIENKTYLPQLNQIENELNDKKIASENFPTAFDQIDNKDQGVYLKSVAFAEEFVEEFSIQKEEEINKLEKYQLTIPIELKIGPNFKCVLRKYQAFGVKYFLQQKKILIGDEMGLGKTIQALAAIEHLFQSGTSHALVVVPASLVPNWLNECTQKTHHSTWPLMGSNRKSTLSVWAENGGIGLVSFTTFGIDIEEYRKSIPFAKTIIIADEAEYVKNPEAKRSIAFQEMISRVEYVLLLTGTPLQNNLGEFKQLINYLDPELTRNLSSEPNSFREQVKPRYLRRNRIDVLHELPEKMEMVEWVDLTDEEAKIHLNQLQTQHFMQYRNTITTETTSKKTRIFELIEEHLLNQDKILVFTFFRTVMDDLSSLCKFPHTSLHGSISVEERQKRLEDFLSNSDVNIAFCQIIAAGRGLNIQGANAVIIVEPQLNPALEDQAIARCYRMGQRKNVFVHRLICKDSIEEKYLEMNHEKRKSFKDYAFESNTKNEYGEATEAELLNAQAKSIETLKKRFE